MNMKYDVVYITGAPGSGKTTLAKQLADKMYSYTYIDPDDLLQSFWETNKDPSYDREKVGIPKMKQTIIGLLENNVRVIFDAQADKELLDTLQTGFNLVNIHCAADNAADRFYQRETAMGGSKPDWLEPHMPEIRRLEVESKDPIDIGQKIISVDCNNDYSPTLDQLLKELGF